MKDKRQLSNVYYREICPAKKDEPKKWQRYHRWKKVKGTTKPHPNGDKAMFVEDMKCDHCQEVIGSEGLGLAQFSL